MQGKHHDFDHNWLHSFAAILNLVILLLLDLFELYNTAVVYMTYRCEHNQEKCCVDGQPASSAGGQEKGVSPSCEFQWPPLGFNVHLWFQWPPLGSSGHRGVSMANTGLDVK
jgi:hypothetical protein